MREVIKWVVGTLLGLVFLWLMFWAYMLFIQAGTFFVIIVVPFAVALMPAITFYRKFIAEKEVSFGEWVFSFVVSGLLFYFVYNYIKFNGVSF